jgi:uncharacterized protein YbjT (DUF2867 family)
MTDKKIIAVVGATGAQGGGLARAILADPDGGFAVRALTRDPSSEAAQALAAAGAEVVAVDIDDEASLDAALQGAYGAFFVTFFWAHFSPAQEDAEAARFAASAKKAGLQHVVWSTLEDTRNWVPLDDDRMPTLQEKFKVPHFDAKGAANHYFTDAGVPTTFLQTTFYWDNFIYFGMGPQRGEDGALTLTFPMGDARLSGISADDIGAVAYGIFKAGDALAGETVSIAGEHLTGEEMAAKLTSALGEPVTYVAIEPAVYRSFGFPGADDLGNMFQFYRDFNDYFVSVRDIDETKKLHPGLKSFDEWLAANKERIPLG